MQPVTDNIPGYLYRPAGLNGQTDPLGHGLLQIYLNPSLEISKRVFQQIDRALHNLTAPEKEAASGFFTVTLTWSGSGDVDLHTFEPNDQWVFFLDPKGTSGYLDVDNRVGQGPEHYFATCDRNRLQMGRYVIAVANYAEATGRVATVQVSSDRDGVLGTRFVQLGEPTEHIPSHLMFEIIVAYDEEDDEFSVSIE